MLYNPFSNLRYNFWSYANYLQLDRGENIVELGDMGYLSGLFKIFDNNPKYCLLIVKKDSCSLCHTTKTDDIFKKSLISIIVF